MYVKGVRMYACPKHKEPVKHRTIKCLEPSCGKTFEVARVGKLPKYCIECRKKKGMFIRYKSEYPEGKDRDAVVIPARSKIIPRSDCKYRYDCLAQAAYKDITKMACNYCTEYEPEEQEYEPRSKYCDDSELYALGC